MIAIEDVYATAFALLQPLLLANGGAFVTVSRRLQLVEDVDIASMPAVYQLQTTMTPMPETFTGIGIWIYHADWYVYAGASSDVAVPSTPILNPRVNDVLNLLPQEAGTAVRVVVDGVAVALNLDGAVDFYEGLLDTKAVAKIPIRIMVSN